MAFGTGSGAGRFFLFLEFLVAVHALVMIGLLEFRNVVLSLEFMACPTLLDFLPLLPNVLAVFEFMMAIGAFNFFVFGVRKDHRALFGLCEHFRGVNGDILFRDLGRCIRQGERGVAPLHRGSSPEQPFLCVSWLSLLKISESHLYLPLNAVSFPLKGVTSEKLHITIPPFFLQTFFEAANPYW